MDNVAVFLEHVDFLNRLDGLDVQLLQRGLQLLVVCARRLVHLFRFSPRRAFASVCEQRGSVSSVLILGVGEKARASLWKSEAGGSRIDLGGGMEWGPMGSCGDESARKRRWLTLKPFISANAVFSIGGKVFGKSRHIRKDRLLTCPHGLLHLCELRLIHDGA